MSTSGARVEEKVSFVGVDESYQSHGLNWNTKEQEN